MRTIVLFCTLALVVCLNTSFKKSYDANSFKIVISKSQYIMDIYDEDNNWLATYPVVFGSDDLGDKLYEGDRRTPEGTFHIVSKRNHPKWSKFMALDYPTKESYQKFNERKQRGEIPYNAKIGGAIGIHGTWPREEFAIDGLQNWTMGCVSTKNNYINEIYNVLPVGTTVVINP